MEAMAVGMGYKRASSYQHYEDPRLFTKKYLPPEIAEKIAGVLAGKGAPPISRDEVLRLAKVDAQIERAQVTSTVAGIDQDALNYAVRTVLRNHVDEAAGTLENEHISGLAERITQAYHAVQKGAKKAI